MSTITEIKDDGEPIGQFEPLSLGISSEFRSGLDDLALTLAIRSTEFRASLPESIAGSLSVLIRSMNCYYSNLIEGHHTHPVDIERALNNDFSDDIKNRNLQLEAKAHIAVQKWIDEGGLQGGATNPDSIQEIHMRFCKLLPPDLLKQLNRNTGEMVPIIPGQFRTGGVKVGFHIAISPGAVPRFMNRFHDAYSSPQLSRIDKILAVAYAHHRLVWIHPFPDGNGRVTRLMSYAMLLEELGNNGLWSIARGLARNVDEYKRLLMECDATNKEIGVDREGLSEEALADFARFFLNCCIDQVNFMEGLMRPDLLRKRILIWAEEEFYRGTLPAKVGTVLSTVLLQGFIPRAEVAKLLGVNERTARRITSALVDCGALTSTSTRAPLQLAFPAKLAGRWMPGLFPDQ